MERPNLPSNQFPPLLMEVSLESCGLLGDLGGTGGGAPRPPLPVWGRSLRTAGKMQVEVGCCSSWQSSSELLEGSLSALGVIMGEPLANPQIASKMQPSVNMISIQTNQPIKLPKKISFHCGIHISFTEPLSGKVYSTMT